MEGRETDIIGRLKRIKALQIGPLKSKNEISRLEPLICSDLRVSEITFLQLPL